MLILVTGATGRIGSHLTRALIRRGHDVRAFTLPDDPRAALIAGPHVEFVYGRLEDAGALEAAVPGVDAIYHLAAALTSRGNSDQEFFDFNLRGTFNLLMAARSQASRLQRFVYASSDAVYHSGTAVDPKYLPIEETYPRLTASVYGATKIGAEELCSTFMRGFGMPATVLRFGATCDAEELIQPRSVFARWLFLREAIDFLARQPGLGAEQRESLDIMRALDNGSEQLLVFADKEGKPEIRQWGDARDVAEGCALVMESPAAVGEAFNLGGLAPFSSAELSQYIAEKLDLPCVTARLPTARPPWYISSAKARGILGYRPRHSVFDMVDEAVAAARG